MSAALPRKRKLKRADAVNFVIFLVILAGAVVMLYPSLWMLSTSFKANKDVYGTGLIPPEWRPENYLKIWDQAPLLRGILNSFTVAIPVVSLSVLTAALAAFAFAKLRFFGRNFFFMLLLAFTMVPFAVYMLPQFVVFKALGILRGPLAILLPRVVGGAFTIFFLRQFLYGIPDSIVESAKIDGASYVRIFFQIILPLAVPAIVAQVILSFIGNWNDYLGPLLFIRGTEWYTVPLVMATFNAGSGGADNSVPLLMAASLISMLPILVVFAVFQKRIVNSVMLSGSKL
jgi:multiple sugar transport system permease protein